MRLLCCTLGHLVQTQFPGLMYCPTRLNVGDGYCNGNLRRLTDQEEASWRLGGMEAYARVWKPHAG